MEEFDLVSEEDTKPLVDWENPPKLEDLKGDYTSAKPTHDVQCNKINDYIAALEGDDPAVKKLPKGSSKIVPRLIRKQAEWRYAALTEPFLSSEDIYNVRPVSWEDRQAAQQNELVLNYQFNTQINKVKFVDEYVRTAVDEGTVIVQVGWKYDEIEVEEEVPIIEFVENPEFAPTLEQVAQLQQESPSQFATDVPDELKQALELTMEHGIPLEPVVKGYEVQKVPKVLKNSPTLTIRPTKNVIIDPTCNGDMSEAKFVIYTFESSVSELQKDGKYQNLDKINKDASDILSAPDHEFAGETNSFNFKDNSRKKFIVHEYWGYWDIHDTGVLEPIVAAWVGNTLIRMELNPFPDRAIPFIVAQYLPIRKSVYGEPDGALLEEHQKIVGAVTRGMVDIMGKSANAQTGVRKDMLDVTNRRRFENGQDYEFNPGIDPRMGVHMHTYNEIPASAQFMLQLQNMEAESMTGVKTFQEGITSQSLGDVAVGIRSALDAASKRELGILRRLADGIVEIGRKFVAMNAQFLSEEEVIRITNDEFVTVKRDDLAGKFDLRLSISTPEEDNNKAEQLAFMLQTVGPNSDPELSKMILADICRLRKMPDLAKRIETYQPEPDPIMQERAMLENEILKSQVLENSTRGENYQSQAALNEAKIGTEYAKAANLSSDTDIKNLDFVEQESGVKQERDLQKQGEQARAQTQMKLTEHQLNMQREQAKGNVDLLKEYIKQQNKPKAK